MEELAGPLQEPASSSSFLFCHQKVERKSNAMNNQVLCAFPSRELSASLSLFTRREGHMYRTPGGYALDVCISSLQKMIRQGREAEAMYWSLELLEQYPRLLWQRLTVCCLEDVGIGHPLAIILIEVGERNRRFNRRQSDGKGNGSFLEGDTVEGTSTPLFH
jgi:hypothetical protein